jgi:hypothetical protein
MHFVDWDMNLLPGEGIVWSGRPERYRLLQPVRDIEQVRYVRDLVASAQVAARTGTPMRDR